LLGGRAAHSCLKGLSMSYHLHPHEEARREAWVRFFVAQIPMQTNRHKDAAEIADMMLEEYDRRFEAPWTSIGGGG